MAFGLRRYLQPRKSAHNRRFNATQADLDNVKTISRVCIEELIHIAGLR